MNSYSLPISTETGAALAALRAGVSHIGVIGRANGLEGVFGCVLETKSGQIIEIRAQGDYLEYKFEVFSVGASITTTAQFEEMQVLSLVGPVQVLLLQTEDWLDPGVSCEGALGQNPIMQCRGQPGGAPSTAVAACTYFGGVELRDANGLTVTIATLAFPCAIHVSAVEKTGKIDRNAFCGIALGSA
ncbi:hypothetical protein ELE36_19420 [Pseudolysobacter antarcticus]|uniref:Uncharacterized protein n=1 Tax=Pseudolysobacter antarcticus TaxID=2511995 RepID=A0A411HPG4_9GAMM|nr:hypothetical protein [Pseudolysobacter antarcticus]QBB72364.1 hypothetical protein ELE36_19420 [Pseudolysobacter antarcticus]